MSFQSDIDSYLNLEYHTTADKATLKQLYAAVSRAAVASIGSRWSNRDNNKKRACYFSAEFLVGRLIFDNLHNLNLLIDRQQLIDFINLGLQCA